MNNQKSNRSIHFWGKSLLITFFISLISLAGFSQNTKGDRPVSNQQQIKESKTRIKKQKRSRKSSASLPKRLLAPKLLPESRASNVYPQPNPYAGRKQKRGDRPAKPIGPSVVSPSDEKRATPWKQDFNGSKIRKDTKTAEIARQKSNIYPQPSPYKNYLAKKSKKREKPWKGDFQGAPIVKRVPREDQRAYHNTYEGGTSKIVSQSGKIKNVYPQTGPSKRSIAKKLNKEPKASFRTASGDLPIRFTPRESEKFQKTQPSFGNAFSATQPFIARGRRNVYWGKFRRGEKPYTKDIAGLKLRRKNYSTKLPALTPQELSVGGNGSAKDKPYIGSSSGVSSSGKRDNAWLGDPNGSALRKTKFHNIEKVGTNAYLRTTTSSKKQHGRNQQNGVGISLSGKLGVGKPLPPNRKIDVGADYSGSIKGKNQKSFSNQGYSFSGNAKSKGGKNYDPSVLYSGFIKRKNGRQFSSNGYNFSGDRKGMRNPLKGGGSISGSTWNNNNKSVTDKLAIGHDISHSYGGFIKGKYAGPSYATQGASFAGKIKFQKPEKGGGSISGKLWNNFGEPVTRRRNLGYMGFDFAGDIKASKPKKGGQSISGKLWNNLEEPITRKRNRGYMGFDFAGNIKATKPKKGGQSVSGRLWNNDEKPIAGTYAANPRVSVGYGGKIRLPSKAYIQNPHASVASNKKRRPEASALAVNGFKSKMRQGNYVHKPKAVEAAMLGLGPGKNTVRASSFVGKLKLRHEYVHNPNSASLALKVLAPAKAYVKIGDFKGKMKIRKASGKNLHPDAQFAHLGESNTKSERTFLTNVKLLWAKMFKKNETQPEAIKPKNEHPLRYDRKEKDLWKALYDYNEVKK